MSAPCALPEPQRHLTCGGGNRRCFEGRRDARAGSSSETPMLRLRTTLVASLALAATLSVPDARAGSTVQNAVGNCNGALPGFEGALRKRPLAIANEGTSSAFVSCTLPVNQSESTGVTIAAVGLINRDTVHRSQLHVVEAGAECRRDSPPSSETIAICQDRAAGLDGQRLRTDHFSEMPACVQLPTNRIAALQPTGMKCRILCMRGRTRMARR